MMDIIKSNLYKYSKSIWGYLFIAIMIIFTGSQIGRASCRERV